MKHTVTCVVALAKEFGPEVAAATQRVLDASGVKIEWEILAARAENTDKKTNRRGMADTTSTPSNAT